MSKSVIIKSKYFIDAINNDHLLTIWTGKLERFKEWDETNLAEWESRTKDEIILHFIPKYNPRPLLNHFYNGKSKYGMKMKLLSKPSNLNTGPDVDTEG